MEFIYRVHQIPATTTDPHLHAFSAGKLSSLRLSALTESPQNFSSTFAIESAYPLSHWLSRVSSPNIRFFVAVAYPASPQNTSASQPQTIDTGIWVASATLLGPVPKSDFAIPNTGGPEPGDDARERKWHMTGLYCAAAHRGVGVARLIVGEVMRFVEGDLHRARGEGGSGSGSELNHRIRCFMHPDNIPVRKLYEGLGWVDAGKCTLREAVVGNGDAATLPKDGGAGDTEKWDTKFGVIMEWTG